MRRFALSFGRFVHPFSVMLGRFDAAGSGHPAGATDPGYMTERLHVERAHAAVHPVHLAAPGRPRAPHVSAVRDIMLRRNTDN